jgi:hypothetical protein
MRSGVPLLFATLLVACASRQEQGVALVARIGAPKLVAEAASLKSRASSGLPAQVPEALWPPAIRELQPQGVQVSEDGVFVQRWNRFVEEEGVFIAFAGAPVSTALGHDPSFASIEPGVYWYKVKG